MPVANKYSVQIANRFQLADSEGDASSSEDEACQNVDPYAMVKQAEVDAFRLAKLKVKEQSKVSVKIITQVAKEEPKQDNRQKTNRREPKANAAPRRGPRNERPQENDNVLSENNNTTAARDDGDRRANRRPRNQDRRSGNPRAGVKATEKRGGGGAGNWGKATEAPADFEEKREESTPEEPSNENTENADPEEKPKEPEEVTMSLEEYYAQETSAAPSASGNTRKANNGEQLKGKVIRKNKIFVERKPVVMSREQGTTEREQKETLFREKMSFLSGRQGGRGGGSNYRYDNNNNDRRQGGRRNDNKGGNARGEKKQDPPRDFSKPATNDFPELGK